MTNALAALRAHQYKGVTMKHAASMQLGGCIGCDVGRADLVCSDHCIVGDLTGTSDTSRATLNARRAKRVHPALVKATTPTLSEAVALPNVVEAGDGHHAVADHQLRREAFKFKCHGSSLQDV